MQWASATRGYICDSCYLCVPQWWSSVTPSLRSRRGLWLAPRIRTWRTATSRGFFTGRSRIIAPTDRGLCTRTRKIQHDLIAELIMSSNRSARTSLPRNIGIYFCFVFRHCDFNFTAFADIFLGVQSTLQYAGCVHACAVINIMCCSWMLANISDWLIDIVYLELFSCKCNQQNVCLLVLSILLVAKYCWWNARVQHVWQITVAAMSGPEADQFLLKVQQAATGHPWYSHAKPVVNIYVYFCLGLYAFQACNVRARVRL